MGPSRRACLMAVTLAAVFYVSHACLRMNPGTMPCPTLKKFTTVPGRSVKTPNEGSANGNRFLKCDAADDGDFTTVVGGGAPTVAANGVYLICLSGKWYQTTNGQPGTPLDAANTEVGCTAPGTCKDCSLPLYSTDVAGDCPSKVDPGLYCSAATALEQSMPNDCAVYDCGGSDDIYIKNAGGMLVKEDTLTCNMDATGYTGTLTAGNYLLTSSVICVNTYSCTRCPVMYNNAVPGARANTDLVDTMATETGNKAVCEKITCMAGQLVYGAGFTKTDYLICDGKDPSTLKDSNGAVVTDQNVACVDCACKEDELPPLVLPICPPGSVCTDAIVDPSGCSIGCPEGFSVNIVNAQYEPTPLNTPEYTCPIGSANWMPALQSPPMQAVNCAKSGLVAASPDPRCKNFPGLMYTTAGDKIIAVCSDSKIFANGNANPTYNQIQCTPTVGTWSPVDDNGVLVDAAACGGASTECTTDCLNSFTNNATPLTVKYQNGNCYISCTNAAQKMSFEGIDNGVVPPATANYQAKTVFCLDGVAFITSPGGTTLESRMFTGCA